MSATVRDEDTMMLCASCGTAEIDDTKLMKCACKLVKYCSVKCQRDHRPQHKKECKKRVAELRDELLFEQPEGNHFGDCPICCLPLPYDSGKFCLNPCCCKRICNGCDLANKRREYEGRLQNTCPFCREALPETDEEEIEQVKKRIEANDPLALCNMGADKYTKGEYKAAFEYWTRAAAVGDAAAHYHLSIMYDEGKGVEKEKKKQMQHSKEAAISGHPIARHNLGCWEARNDRVDRAAKHFIIAARLGDDKSLEFVKELYKAGIVSKDDFTAALRGYQAALAAAKSPQREEAAEIEKKLGGFY